MHCIWKANDTYQLALKVGDKLTHSDDKKFGASIPAGKVNHHAVELLIQILEVQI